MRIALLGLSQESNTFSAFPVDLAKLEAEGTVRGRQMTELHADAGSSLAGFLSAAADDVEVVPLSWFVSNPAGPVTASAFEAVLDEMIGQLAGSGPWDAIFLAQHGAGVAERYPDLEAEVLSRVRGLVGADLPIGVTFDMHANVSPEVVALSTVVVGFRTNPHVDARERAVECADLIVRTVRGEINPVISFRQIDAVINILRQATAEEPMRGIMADAELSLAAPGVLSYSVFEGYPYADVPQMGMSCLVISDGSRAVADAAVDRIADRIWQARGEFQGSAVAPAEAVLEFDEAGPVLLLDVGDNVGAGGDGRSTVLLKEILAAGIAGAAIIIQDAEAAAACTAAGVGGVLDLSIGRPSLAIRGTVVGLSDGRYEDPQPSHGGFRYFDAGASAVLALENDNLVLVTAGLCLPTSPEQLRAAGIAPESRRLIVGKGVVSPQAGYGRVTSRFVLVNTPGCTTSDLLSLDYRHRRQLYPFEAEQ